MTACESNSKHSTEKKQETTNHSVSYNRSEISADRLFLAEELAHFGTWEWDVTQPRAIWSPEMFHIFGLEPRVGGGLTMEEYISFIHPDDLPEVNKIIADSLVNVKLNQIEEIDYRIIRRDNSIRILHSQRLIKEVTPEGKLKVIVGVDQDVTEQKQAEEALRRSEERFRVVAEAAKVLVYESDLVTGKVHFIRGEKELFGSEPKKTEDRTSEWLLNRIHPDDAPKVLATWNEVKNNPEIDQFSIEYRLKHASGSYIIVKDTAKAIKDQNGKTILCIGGLRDITQRRIDQEKLQQYSKHLEQLVQERTEKLISYERLAAIGQVTGMVGHDIRNPLQALSGEVYLIRTELEEINQKEAKENIKESLDSIEQGISYINKIIADLQDYSRKLNPEMKTVNLTELIDDVFETIEVPKNIKLIIRIEKLQKINIDPIFTKRALTNLINNSIQAMTNGGELEVGIFGKEDNIYITIADTGNGIPNEIKPKIFTPMFTTKSKGQGLGLAVVKRLVEAQGGSISFESSVGKGTKFIIKLPLN